jgi:hypothetical protein
MVSESSEGLILSGNQSLVITNQDYIVNGSIIIRDNASLKLVNSHLDFTQGNWTFELLDSGHLELDHSDINMTVPYNIGAHDNSSIKLLNSEVFKQFWCTIHLTYHYTYAINLLDESRLYANNSSIGILNTSKDTVSNIADSFIGELMQCSSSLHLRNTTIAVLEFMLNNGNYSCRLKLSDNIKNWDSKLEGGGIPGNITFDDVGITQTYCLYTVNCTLRLRDSNPDFIVCQGHSEISVEDSVTQSLNIRGNATLDISNSSIKLLDASDATIQSLTIRKSRIGSTTFTLSENAVIEDSQIDKWDSGWYSWIGSTRQVTIKDSSFVNMTINSHTVYSLRNVTVKNDAWIQPDFNEIRPTYISGGLVYGGDLQSFDSYGVDNLFYQVTRGFEVKVLRGGAQLQSASLELRRDNETIWRGTSDYLGESRFNLTFSRIMVVNPIPGQPPLVDTNNMTNTLTLLVRDGGDTRSMTLGVLSSTPLVASFPSLTGTQSAWVAALIILALLVSVVLTLLKTTRLLN